MGGNPRTVFLSLMMIETWSKLLTALSHESRLKVTPLPPIPVKYRQYGKICILKYSYFCHLQLRVAPIWEPVNHLATLALFALPMLVILSSTCTRLENSCFAMESRGPIEFLFTSAPPSSLPHPLSTPPPEKKLFNAEAADADSPSGLSLAHMSVDKYLKPRAQALAHYYALTGGHHVETSSFRWLSP